MLAVVFWDSIGVLLLLDLLLRGHLTATDTVLDWKAGEKPSGEEVPVFVFIRWFCSLRVPDHAKHSRLVTCCRILVGKHWTIPHIVGICHIAIFILLVPSSTTCHDIASPAMKMANVLSSRGWRNRDIRLYFRVGQTTLWQVTNSFKFHKIASSFKIQTEAVLNTKRYYKSHNYNIDGKYFHWKYYAWYSASIFGFHRASWHSSATRTEVFPCFFLSCKANTRVYLAKTGHVPHSSYLVNCVLCIVLCR